jgi:hypothetical protein
VLAIAPTLEDGEIEGPRIADDGGVHAAEESNEGGKSIDWLHGQE